MAAEGAQQPGDLLRAPAGDNAVQALAIEVDHPDHPSEALQVVLAQRLPDIPLVQFGVAHQSQKAVRLVVSEMVFDITAHQRHEIRHHRAESYRARGEMDAVGVLQAAGVSLQTAEAAILQEFLAGQVSQQILNSVVDRRGVRLDGDQVAGLGRSEVISRQQADDGGATGLVSADLDRVDVGTDVIRVVDQVGTQPEDPILNAVQKFQIGAGRRFDGRR